MKTQRQRVAVYRFPFGFGVEVRSYGSRRQRVQFEGKPSEIMPIIRCLRYAEKTHNVGELIAYAKNLQDSWLGWRAS